MKDVEARIVIHDQGIRWKGFSAERAAFREVLNSCRDSVFVVHNKHAVFLLTLANFEKSLLVSVENSGEIRKYLCQFEHPNGVKC